MTCAEVREEFSALMDGELAPELRAAVEAHIAQCSDCLRELDALKRIDGIYRDLPRQAAPEGFEESVRRTINAAPAAPRLRLLPRLVPFLAAAAILLLVLGGVVLRNQMNQKAFRTAAFQKEQEVLKRGLAVKAPAAPAIPQESVEQLKALGYMKEKGEAAVAPSAPPEAKAAPAPPPAAALEPMTLSKRAAIPDSAKPAPKADAVKSKLPAADAQESNAAAGGAPADASSAASTPKPAAPAATEPPPRERALDQAAPIRASRNAARRHVEKGDALVARGELDAAASNYRSAVSLAPQNVQALTKLGGVLLRQGKKEEALGRFTQAAHLDPRNTAALCGMGQALHLLGKTDDAVQQFRKALEIDPNCAAAKQGLERAQSKPSETAP